VSASVDAIPKAEHAPVPGKRGHISRLMDACMRRTDGLNIPDILSLSATIFVRATNIAGIGSVSQISIVYYSVDIASQK